MSNHHMLTRRKSRSQAPSSTPEDLGEASPNPNPKKRKREVDKARASVRGRKKLITEQSENPTLVVSKEDNAISGSQNLASTPSQNSVVLKENEPPSSGSKRARCSPRKSVIRRSSRDRKKTRKLLENECQEQQNDNGPMMQNLSSIKEVYSQSSSGKDGIQMEKYVHDGDLNIVTSQEERQDTQSEATSQQPVVQATSNDDCQTVSNAIVLFSEQPVVQATLNDHHQTASNAIVLFSEDHQNLDIAPSASNNSNMTPNQKGRSKLQARRKSSLVQSCRSTKAATLRWKHLAESILKEKYAVSMADSQKSSTNRTKNKVGQKSKKQKRKDYTSSAMSKEKHRVPRKIDDVLKRMDTWLTDAKFPLIETESEKAFTMSEGDREAFAKYMVEACEKNPNLQNVLLESVRVLVESGVMHSAASALVQEGPCKEAESVLSAWQDFQRSKNEFPLGILNAVNQLHEKIDLTNKLSISGYSNRLAFDQTEETSWRFQLGKVLPQNASNPEQDDPSIHDDLNRLP